ncbi:MAG: divalent metal cation transporter [Planctomycetota bacterium]|jgi:Mn2+/Fe2+ NRAMP family transporter
MKDRQKHNDLGGGKAVKGLPMFTASAPEVLAREKAELAELQSRHFLQRWRGFFAKTGPGWLQSALILGSGSAWASLYIGAFFGYQLLWVQPVAMVLGIVMFAAMSYQTLSTGVRPFYAMKRYIHPVVGWSWAIGALLATVIWHLPQYALAGGMTEDIIKAATGWTPSSPAVQKIVLVGIGLAVLSISTAVVWTYSSGHRGIRLYERILKGFVWMIIVAFAIVIVHRAIDGGVQWGKLFKGFLPLYIPTDPRGVSIVMAAFSAATGINATFLFPYTLLARGWGKEHRGLSRFDLVTGMLLPFSIATSLMVVATACTIYDPVQFASGSTKLSPIVVAAMLESAGLSLFFSRIVFGLGILGMAMSSITMHMLICGFAACEVFGVEPGGWRYRLACLIPAPGVVGVILWPYVGPWVAIPTSAICGLMLPIAFVAFFVLNNSRKYLGDDKPRGTKAMIWNVAMIISMGAAFASIIYYLVSLI